MCIYILLFFIILLKTYVTILLSTQYRLKPSHICTQAHRYNPTHILPHYKHIQNTKLVGSLES
jgi:hypothetical protein